VIHSYGKIYHLGHRAVADIFDGTVVIEEKIDGSQFSFGRIGDRFFARSRSVEINLEDPQKLFAPALDHLKGQIDAMPDGYVFRGECVSKPRHNTLAYDRTPRGFVMLFDVDTGGEFYDARKEEWADRLGIEAVPLIYQGIITGREQIDAMLERTSVLGGQKIEGVVIKNYGKFGDDHRILMAKLVRADFREQNDANWKQTKPGQKDIVGRVVDSLRTIPRWRKAVEHLRDRGDLAEAPQDIGKLLKELSVDTEAECADEIKEALYQWARGDILRGVQRGFAEWYKSGLAERQFAADPIAQALVDSEARGGTTLEYSLDGGRSFSEVREEA
jgi:hypothetical protein